MTCYSLICSLVASVTEDAHSLLKSYLTNRFQHTSVGASLSEPVHLQFGIPQGSVLGPILFTLNTSSLATLLEAHDVAYHFYADDTQIYIRIDSTEDVKGKLSSLINDIKIWMNGRKLKLNDGKTELIIVKGNLRSNVVEEFGNLELPCAHLCPSVSARNLGIIFDSMLNFKNHINSVVRLLTTIFGICIVLGNSWIKIVLLHLYTLLLFLELIIAILFIWDSLIIY